LRIGIPLSGGRGNTILVVSTPWLSPVMALQKKDQFGLPYLSGESTWALMRD
jgi:hypothetical protein